MLDQAQPSEQNWKIPHIPVWVATVPFAFWAFARVFGLDEATLAVQLLSFTPYMAAASVLVVVVMLVARRWWAAAVAAAACVTLAACVAPRAIGAPSTMDGVPIIVMSQNMLVGGADVEAIVRLVRDQRVDVLAVQEFTPQAQRRLADAGLGQLLPYQANHAAPTTTGSGLYSRWPLTETGAVNNHGGFWQAYGEIRLPGALPVRVESAHPVPPIGSAGPWRQDLSDQAPPAARGTPSILMGDFNSTLDHPELRRILASGYIDAAASVGRGLIPTWPYEVQPFYVPKVTIDHVLCDPRIGATSFAAFTVARTDHRAIVAHLTLPRSPNQH